MTQSGHGSRHHPPPPSLSISICSVPAASVIRYIHIPLAGQEYMTGVRGMLGPAILPWRVEDSRIRHRSDFVLFVNVNIPSSPAPKSNFNPNSKSVCGCQPAGTTHVSVSLLNYATTIYYISHNCHHRRCARTHRNRRHSRRDCQDSLLRLPGAVRIVTVVRPPEARSLIDHSVAVDDGGIRIYSESG